MKVAIENRDVIGRAVLLGAAGLQQGTVRDAETALLRKALSEEDKVGIAKVSFRDKEHLAALRFTDEALRAIAPTSIPSAWASAGFATMARTRAPAGLRRYQSTSAASRLTMPRKRKSGTMAPTPRNGARPLSGCSEAGRVDSGRRGSSRLACTKAACVDASACAGVTSSFNRPAS